MVQAQALAGVAEAVWYHYVAAAVINYAIAAVIGKILEPDMDKSGRDAKGLQQILKSNVAPRRVIYGEAVVGGSYLYVETTAGGTSEPNEFLRYIIVLAGHPIEDLLGIFIGDKYIKTAEPENLISGETADITYSSGRVSSGIFGTGDATDHVKIIKVLGWGFADNTYVTDSTATKSAEDRTRANLVDGALATDWDTTPAESRDTGTGLWGRAHKVTNCAYVFLEFRANPDVFGSYPNVKFHVKGKPVYDPALDSSLAEYGADSAGIHDLNDPDTHEWSENWSTACLDYLINTSYGLAAKTSGDLVEVDWEEAVQASLDSTELISSGEGSPYIQNIPRYTLNGIFEVNSTPISNMESLLVSGAGSLIYSQGKYKLRAGVYRAADSESNVINEDMLIGGLTIQTHTPRAELFNKVSGVYVDTGYDKDLPILEESNQPTFEPSDFPPVDPVDGSGLNPYEIIDGEEIIKELDFPYCIYHWEAQRLAKIQLERIRQGLIIQFNATLEVLKYSVGDTIYLEILSNNKYLNEAFFNKLGLDDEVQNRPNSPGTPYYKQFKITEMAYNGDFSISVSLAEESEEIYDWNEGDAISIDYVLGNNLIIDDPQDTILIPGWVVDSPYSTITEDIATESGTTVTALLRWTAADRGSSLNALDRAQTVSYTVEYGIVTDFSNATVADRVATWISAGNIAADRINLTQGPIALETLYKDGDTYDFRVRAILNTGRRSAWAYYYEDIGSDYNPSAPPASSNTQYYILATNGSAIHNGIGTLTLEAHEIVGGIDSIISTGSPQLYVNGTTLVNTANGYASPSDGYTGTFDAGDISNSIVVELREGSGGTILDTITLVDIADGTAGGAGADAYYGYIEATDGTAWTQAVNGGAWNPVSSTTQLDFTVVQNGIIVAQDAYLVTRDGAGLLTGSVATHSNSPGDFADSPGNININVSGSGSQAITIEFVYTNGSDSISVGETVITSVGADDGSTGSAGYNNKVIQAYKRASSIPGDNPGGITYTFSTNTIDSPGLNNSWLEDIPADDGNPLWVVAASASSNTDTDTIASGEWSTPVQLADSGDDGSAGLNNATVFLYQRTATESPIPSVPSSTITYNFSDGSIDSPGPDNDWSNILPLGGDPYLWMTLATASNISASDTIDTGEWSAPELLATDGTDGAAGSDGFSDMLTNEAHVVATDSEGTNYSFTGAGGTHKLWEGTTERTTSATHSVVGGSGSPHELTQNGLTMSIVVATGVYSLSDESPGWTSDSETFTLRANYGSVDYDKVYTITKSKAGVDGGSAGVVVVSGQVIAFNASGGGYAFLKIDNDGNVYEYEGASGTPTYVQIDTGTDWIRPTGDAGVNYQVRATLDSSQNKGLDSGTVDSWLSLDTDRVWSVYENLAQQSQAVLTIEIRHVSFGIIDTGSYTLRASDL